MTSNCAICGHVIKVDGDSDIDDLICLDCYDRWQGMQEGDDPEVWEMYPWEFDDPADKTS